MSSRTGSLPHMTRTVTVQVGEDHLADFRGTPLTGVAELVWNALDADAMHVDVVVEENEMEGVAAVLVIDDGLGMSLTEATSGFGNVGNSWKKAPRTTPSGRGLHGKHGRGRYTAYSIGDHVTWSTVHEDGGVRTALDLVGRGSTLKSVLLSDPVETDSPSGTTVRIEFVSARARTELLRESVLDELTARFAPYLQQFPDVVVTYRGNRLDPQRIHERSDVLALPVPNEGGAADVLVVEWAAKAKIQRILYLCDRNGSALHEVPPGIAPAGYRFTAYLRWDEFRDMGHNILLADVQGGPGNYVVSNARAALRRYFTDRQEEKRRQIIGNWRAEGVYPYKGEPASPIEVAERQAFDVVALSAASVVNEANARGRRLSLGLLRTALEAGPQALRNVLRNVLELSNDKVEELDQLLTRGTTLANMIESSRRIAERLDFIQGLNAMLFDPGSRKETLERRQLHRILANETWLFGEEWALTGDDDRLNQVLKKHLAFLGQDVELADDTPIVRADGREAIPDLVLARALETAEDRFEHLVVELKRPSHRLRSEDLDQVRSYAGAVTRDERFAQPTAQWTFWLVGNSTDADVDDQRDSPRLPFGLVTESKRYTVWVKTWAEVLGSAVHRHKFVRDSLDYTTNRDRGIASLRERHAEFLPPSMAPDTAASSPDGTHPNGIAANP